MKHHSRQVPAQPSRLHVLTSLVLTAKMKQMHPAFLPSRLSIVDLRPTCHRTIHSLWVCQEQGQLVAVAGRHVRGRDQGRGPAGGSSPVRSSISTIDSAPQDSLSDENESEDNNSESDAPPVPPAKRKSKKRGPHKRRRRPEYYGFLHA